MLKDLYTMVPSCFCSSFLEDFIVAYNVCNLSLGRIAHNYYKPILVSEFHRMQIMDISKLRFHIALH
jgi:hypothetical protein